MGSPRMNFLKATVQRPSPSGVEVVIGDGMSIHVARDGGGLAPGPADAGRAARASGDRRGRRPATCQPMVNLTEHLGGVTFFYSTAGVRRDADHRGAGAVLRRERRHGAGPPRPRLVPPVRQRRPSARHGGVAGEGCVAILRYCSGWGSRRVSWQGSRKLSWPALSRPPTCASDTVWVAGSSPAMTIDQGACAYSPLVMAGLDPATYPPERHGLGSRLEAGYDKGTRRCGPAEVPAYMLTEFSFYVTAIPAVILLGLSKGGFAGLGALGMPLMALTISPVQAAAITLPILIVQDVFSVWVYRRTWDRTNLRDPAAGGHRRHPARLSVRGARAGCGRGAGAGHHLDRLRPAAFLAGRFGTAALEPATANRPVGWFWGAVAGFTSMIAHAGGPPFQIYVVPQKLPRDIFVGTGVMFFALVNLIKVPPYLALGQFSPREPADLGSTVSARHRLDLGRRLAGAPLLQRAVLRHRLRPAAPARLQAGGRRHPYCPALALDCWAAINASSGSRPRPDAMPYASARCLATLAGSAAASRRSAVASRAR